MTLFNKTSSSILFLSCLSTFAHANLTNFGDPNTHTLTQAMTNHSVHVVQLGDSHTAGDTMTDALRDRLQGVMGDGGMGWAMPMYFSGQRMARFSYDNVDFSPISSRTNQSISYTLGGLVATPQTNGASLTLKPKKGNEPTQKIWVSIRQSPNDGRFTGVDARGHQFILEAPHKNNSWQMVVVDAMPPFTIYSENATNSAIGGWWAFNPSGRGAVVSALGINGAELSHWSRWNTNAWKNELAIISPNLIILAYGTNEAYNNVSVDIVRTTLTEKVRQVRTASPRSAIMILGAPESLKSTNGGCGTRPTHLSEIQIAQQQVAQNERTLYWDWQSAMGGSCTMKSWINQGLANKDGVHFSKSGYQRLGYQLANDLLSLQTQNAPITYNIGQTQSTSTSHANANGQGRGFIRIERAK
ncbi:MAG: GDSL-type esterase/lipase family protein [Moraxella sp.]|uniref:GDSL-type esterase/lipase family protein n=1 Tax=Moraxella sp. TaxID=479 RepID=UPI0026DB3481|nr:GDSL-type esterase/lipase family protein [Moraxella sp.]MDO4450383.1 GDSL-type esterase/lipase family protein [Moraxella sp.]